jgi:hypothetical protein
MLSIIDQILLVVLAGAGVGGVVLSMILKAKHPTTYPRAQTQ